jgi:hypothetical protein
MPAAGSSQQGIQSKLNSWSRSDLLESSVKTAISPPPVLATSEVFETADGKVIEQTLTIGVGCKRSLLSPMGCFCATFADDQTRIECSCYSVQ